MRPESHVLLVASAALMACTTSQEGSVPGYASGPVPIFSDDAAPAADPLIAGHRLMRAGEYELALRNFNRAMALKGASGEILASIGSANQQLGRLSQAERFLQAAVREAPDNVSAWNNLGVVLQSRDDYPGAVAAFRMAFALDSGRSDLIRQNLNNAEVQNAGRGPLLGATNPALKLVPQGHGRYLLGNAN